MEINKLLWLHLVGFYIILPTAGKRYDFELTVSTKSPNLICMCVGVRCVWDEEAGNETHTHTHTHTHTWCASYDRVSHKLSAPRLRQSLVTEWCHNPDLNEDRVLNSAGKCTYEKKKLSVKRKHNNYTSHAARRLTELIYTHSLWCHIRKYRIIYVSSCASSCLLCTCNLTYTLETSAAFVRYPWQLVLNVLNPQCTADLVYSYVSR